VPAHPEKKVSGHSPYLIRYFAALLLSAFPGTASAMLFIQKQKKRSSREQNCSFLDLQFFWPVFGRCLDRGISPEIVRYVVVDTIK
jgi:hypothetical protein